MGRTPAPTGHALVLGGGISGLLSARELAAAGHRVTVLEQSGTWGGCVGSHVVAGLTLDSGAESFATRSDAVAALAAELGLAGNIVAPRPGGAWVQLPDGPRELPKTGVLGIPANPWDPEVWRSLGLAGALRASLDRFLPASVGASREVTSVAALVKARMGRRVLERLVAPVVGGVHSADPGLLDVDMVAPGLRAGLRREGSLAGAVQAQRRGTSQAGTAGPPAKAGSAVAGLEGGMHTLIGALLESLRSSGVTLISGTRADTVARTAGGWRVVAGGTSYDAALLVVAVDGPAAVDLLATAVPAVAGKKPASGPDVRLVTLVVDKPALDARPRGTGILVAPQTPGIEAKALTHASGKWDWVQAAAGPGRHVLRLSYGRVEGTEGRPANGVDDDGDLLAAALQDASALLDVPIGQDDVAGWDVVRWPGSLPFAAVGHRARVLDIREACSAAGGLALVGGWVAGNGLAAVVSDTRTQIAKLLG